MFLQNMCESHKTDDLEVGSITIYLLAIITIDLLSLVSAIMVFKVLK